MLYRIFVFFFELLHTYRTERERLDYIRKAAYILYTDESYGITQEYWIVVLENVSPQAIWQEFEFIY